MSRIALIQLSEIKHVSYNELSVDRLNKLESGNKTLERIINETNDIITLQGKRPYDIIDGRHRIFLARKLGLKSIRVLIQ